MRATLVVGVSSLLASSLMAQASPAQLHWEPAPDAFPKGAQMAVVSGNPGAAGLFTIELSMPSGYRIPPHFHPTDEHVVIKQGSFLVGMGDQLDVKQTRAMAVGDTGTIPAKGHHYGITKGATIVAVTAMGPFAMTYVHPADDPRKANSSGY